jgi:hypothetical protein
VQQGGLGGGGGEFESYYSRLMHSEKLVKGFSGIDTSKERRSLL